MVVILALCVGFASCNKDDDKDNNGNNGSNGNNGNNGNGSTIENLQEKIVGKWQMDKSAYSSEALSEMEDCDFEGYFEFKADNTFFLYDPCEEEEGEEGGVTWSVNGNVVTVTIMAIPQLGMPEMPMMSLAVESISGDKLKGSKHSFRTKRKRNSIFKKDKIRIHN